MAKLAKNRIDEFTAENLATLDCDEGQRVWWWDGRQRGFGLELRRNGDGLSMRYVVRTGRDDRRLLTWIDPKGRERFMHFWPEPRNTGSPDDRSWNPRDARKEALRWLSKLAQGEDPTAPVEDKTAKTKLRTVVQEYLNDPDWRRKVSEDYRKQIANMFSEEPGAGYTCMKRWLGQDVNKLTRAAVLTLREDLIKECSKRKDTDGRAQAHKVLRALERVLDRAFALVAGTRPDNPIRVLTDMDKWSRKAGPGIAPPLEDDELARVIKVLNKWTRKDGQGPIQRRINLIQLLTGFRFERAQSLRRDMVRKVKEKVGGKMVERSYLYFKPEQGKHKSREFFFPITPELKRVLDACKYEIAGDYFTPDSSWLKPTNSPDWWEHLFEDAELDREQGGSHRIRATVSTHVAALNEGNPFASSYLLDHSPKGVANVTAESYLDMRRWSHGWLQRWHTHLIKDLKLRLP